MLIRFCDTFIDASRFKTRKGFHGRTIPINELVRKIENNMIERNIIVEMFDLDRNTLLYIHIMTMMIKVHVTQACLTKNS